MINATYPGRHWKSAVFWAIVILGGFLRFYALGHIPAGLNGDEAEEGVEAISLLATSMDRWGDRFPVFFPHVGSGMNALYTYLTLPVFYLVGPSVTALRVVSATLGLLTLFTTYAIGKIHYGRDTGLLAMFLVAFLPWHFMISRWGVEWSILPFWFSLGIVTMSMALKPETNPGWKLVAFLPWAIGAYSYFAATIPIAAISLLTGLFYWKPILRRWQWWLGGLAVAILVDTPLLLFILVNFLHITFPLRLALPFSIPILPVSRLSEIGEPFLPQTLKNLTFLVGGYQDGLVWNDSGNFAPLTNAAPVLTILAVMSMGAAWMKDRRPRFLLIILATAVVSVLTIRLNVNRFNWFFIPSIVAVSGLASGVHRAFPDRGYRRALAATCAVYVTIFLGTFYIYYFSYYNTEILAEDDMLGNGFRVGIDQALRDATVAAKPGETIFVDAGKSHPYLYVIFYGFADIRSFQTTRKMRTAPDGLYHVTGFDRFIFEKEAIPGDASYTFVSRPDRQPCENAEIASAGPLWTVGRCQPPASHG